MLHAAGADVNALDNDGRTPMYYYDEGEKAKYDSLVADITRKVATIASLKGPGYSATAARLSTAISTALGSSSAPRLSSDSENDDLSY